MARKTINTDEIDEDFIIASIKNNKQELENKQEATLPKKAVQKKRQKSEPGYTSLFIYQSESKARSGKLVPIRPEYHERILKIVRTIAGDEISIFNYIDNVLTHHFEEFQEDIIKNYQEKNTDIF